MNCMKCGREIPLGQVFCKDCLDDMETAPVKPGTPVQIPVQEATAPARRGAHSRKAPKPEEQLAKLRRFVVFQTLALFSVLIAFGITIGILVNEIHEMSEETLPGQNYSITDNTG